MSDKFQLLIAKAAHAQAAAIVSAVQHNGQMSTINLQKSDLFIRAAEKALEEEEQAKKFPPTDKPLPPLNTKHLIPQYELEKGDHFFWNMHVRALPITFRAQNCLLAYKVRYVGELMQLTPKALTKAQNLGPISIANIKSILLTINPPENESSWKAPSNEPDFNFWVADLEWSVVQAFARYVKDFYGHYDDLIIRTGLPKIRPKERNAPFKFGVYVYPVSMATDRLVEMVKLPSYGQLMRKLHSKEFEFATKLQAIGIKANVVKYPIDKKS